MSLRDQQDALDKAIRRWDELETMAKELQTPLNMQFDRRYLIHGFLPAFFSACCFAVMAVCIKIASSELPAVQLVFLRSIIGFTNHPANCFAARNQFYKDARSCTCTCFVAFISICAMTCFFYAISKVGLSESTLLNASSPLFIGLLAMPVLKEKITLRSAMALVVGFIGVCFILKPGTAYLPSPP